MKQRPFLCVLSFVLCLVLLSGMLTACQQVIYPETYWIEFPANYQATCMEVVLDTIKEDFDKQPNRQQLNFKNVEYILLPQVSEEYKIETIVAEGDILRYVLQRKDAVSVNGRFSPRRISVSIHLAPMQKSEQTAFRERLEKAPFSETVKESSGREYKDAYEAYTVGDISYLHIVRTDSEDRYQAARLSTVVEGHTADIEIALADRGDRELTPYESEDEFQAVLHAVKSFYAMPVKTVQEQGREALKGTPLYDPVSATISTKSTTTLPCLTRTTAAAN